MAHVLPHNVMRRMMQMRLAPQNVPQGGNPHLNKSDSKKEDDGVYHPTPVDIVVVRVMLMRGTKLPADIVDAIFDQAEYWAHSSNDINYKEEHRDVLRIAGSGATENKFLLRSFPVGLTGIYENQDLAEELAFCTKEAKPRPLSQEQDPEFFAKIADYPAPFLEHPVRKVVFTIKSKDQGWNSRRGLAEYEESWTWFEAGLEKFEAGQTCDSLCTYDVRHKSKDSKAPILPVCTLRPVYPEIEPTEPDTPESRPQDDPTSADLAESLAQSKVKEDGPKYKYKFPLHADEKWTIQKNRTAKRDYREHVVTWSYIDGISADSAEAKELLEDKGRGRGTGDGSFVRDLKMGDVITLWGKSRFPGWTNHVERVKIDVYWAV